MNFSSWAIRQPTPSILLFFMLTVAGLIAFERLGIQSMPDMEFPSVSLVANVPGAAPEQLEAEVARPIEDAVSSIGSVRHVTTTINDGVVSMMIEFAYEKQTQEAVIDVRDAVARIRSTLPSEMQEPVVSRVEIAGLPMVTYAVSSDRMDEADLSWFVDDTVSRTLLQVRGVAEVRRQGGVTREVRVELDPIRLQAQQVTPGQISSQLRRMQQEAPGGRGDLSGLEQTVRTLGTVTDASALAQMSLPLADGRRLRLADVAEVRDTHAERRQLALLDGERVVGVDIMRARGHDDVTTSKGVYAAIEALQDAHPQVRFVEVSNTVDHSKSEYQAAMRALYEGCILAVLVVWAFLRDWRATLVSAVALPLSIIPTFIVIMAMGYYLNVLTLLALTLVIGILVDDAIVEVENIMRHLEMGKPPLKAAMEAADEIGLAVIATSLTLVAVFLPTAFAGGMTGSLFRQFGWTAAAAVLFSLLVARLLTPMMAAYLLKPRTQVHHDGRLMLGYLKAARWCLDHPRTTVVGAGAFFLVSLVMIGQLPMAFIAGTDSSNEVAIVEAPPGSSLEQTRELAERARVLLADLPFVELVYTTIGAGVQTGNIRDSLAAAEVRTAQLTARFTAEAGRRYTIDELRVAMREALAPLPGARVSIGRGTPGEKMNLILAGDDPQVLMRTARAVETELRTLRGIGAVTSSASLQRPEIVIRPDFARAAELGITSAAIGEVVRVATVGDYDFNLPRMNLPGRQLYVRVQLDPDARSDPAMIGQLRVRSDAGYAVPLANIAGISLAGGPAQIDRYDRSRVVKLSVDLEGRPIGDVLKEARALPTLRALPSGVREIESGDVEYMTEMVDGFMLAMLAGIFCVYAVMVLLFHDFGQPVTVLAALPLAATGALGLLWLFGLPLSMSALIGLLMLIGIVTKNSILLVDYAIMARRDLGMNRTDALIDACHKRARPIVMTTVAMGAGMMPIALVISGDDAFRQPMALVVIGGLITSTVLSLLVVPVVFEIVDEFKARVMPRGLGAQAVESTG
ncbi:MAG: efflux RND transporter permease subunit [Sinimarinibacterium flocculans]|uniref:efflux RND transporter permease subunit n=1 Tax=Sinimarinibacterium flocculans TaxID=985250 RepID=UPI003C396225